MKLVNRSALVLKPMAKMLDWINSVGEESATVTPEEAQEMTKGRCFPRTPPTWRRFLSSGIVLFQEKGVPKLCPRGIKVVQIHS
jgi:hypothetical protein